MGELIADVMVARGMNEENPDYPCGKVANGGAITIYTKYEWDQHKEHDAIDATLKKAGRKWGKMRPPNQQKFMSKCVQTLQEKLN